MNKPKKINFKRIGKPSEGYLSIGEQNAEIPFEVKRIFWTYYTPEEVVRGRHAHFNTEMVLVSVSGKTIVHTEMIDGTLNEYILDKPDIAVYLPKMCWHTMQFSHNAVLLVITSTKYSENDYIRSYETFNDYKSLSFVEYNEIFLEKSWKWLNESEIKKLTLTPTFTKEQQVQFFNSLKERKDYFIKGILFNSEAIGACGLKNIDKQNQTAEFWAYIGEKQLWGKKLGVKILDEMFNQAKLLNLKSITLNVSAENIRAISLYEKIGFVKTSTQNKIHSYLLNVIDYFK
jgi:RimJ/RimL family protein N-acetyltransferase